MSVRQASRSTKVASAALLFCSTSLLLLVLAFPSGTSEEKVMIVEPDIAPGYYSLEFSAVEDGRLCSKNHQQTFLVTVKESDQIRKIWEVDFKIPKEEVLFTIDPVFIDPSKKHAIEVSFDSASCSVSDLIFRRSERISTYSSSSLDYEIEKQDNELDLFLVSEPGAGFPEEISYSIGRHGAGSLVLDRESRDYNLLGTYPANEMLVLSLNGDSKAGLGVASIISIESNPNPKIGLPEKVDISSESFSNGEAAGREGKANSSEIIKNIPLKPLKPIDGRSHQARTSSDSLEMPLNEADAIHQEDTSEQNEQYIRKTSLKEKEKPNGLVSFSSFLKKLDLSENPFKEGGR